MPGLYVYTASDFSITDHKSKVVSLSTLATTNIGSLPPGQLDKYKFAITGQPDHVAINDTDGIFNTSGGQTITTADGGFQGATITPIHTIHNSTTGLTLSVVRIVSGSTTTYALVSNAPLNAATYTGFRPSSAPIAYGAPCLTRGTLIETQRGLVAVEDLEAGDMIATADDGFQPLRLKLSRKLDAGELAANPKLRPIRITAGAMGEMLPKRDLVVSPQHRMLVSSAIVRRMFDQDEVLVAATRLTAMPGIYVDENATEVEYFHLLMDTHQVIFAEGAATESFYTGPMALSSISPEALAEIQAIFPDLGEPKAARQIPAGAMQRELIERHQKNGKELRSA